MRIKGLTAVVQLHLTGMKLQSLLRHFVRQRGNRLICCVLISHYRVHDSPAASLLGVQFQGCAGRSMSGNTLVTVRSTKSLSKLTVHTSRLQRDVQILYLIFSHHTIQCCSSRVQGCVLLTLALRAALKITQLEKQNNKLMIAIMIN